MRLILSRIYHADPTLFVFNFGVWSIVCGVSLLLPGNIFDFSPAWNQLHAIYADDTAWGALMVASGLLQIASIRMHRIPHRASIALSTAILWFPLGFSLCISSYRGGFASIVGIYCIVGAIGCVCAVEQWVRTAGRSSGGYR